MNYGQIKNCDIANGEGVRVTLFVSGCTNHCDQCFQPETWDFGYGKPFTADTEEYLLRLLSPGYITGLTLLGGGAQLFALDRALSRQLKLNCRVAEDPQACVCMGAGRTVEEGGGYERAMFDLKLPGRKRK